LDSFSPEYNGIYEVEFYDSNGNDGNGLTYYSAVEVTEARYASYIKLVGDDMQIYGILGTPTTVSTLTIVVVAPNCPFIYKVYVNNVLRISSILTINLVNLNLVPGDTIVVLVTNCCDVTLSATTYILPFSVDPPTPPITPP
jgi:hypothetical protein